MKLKQPGLGRKIAELRKAKGYTQEELVEKCNLSVRTLQRIESGEVEPRSYTIKVIFEALDYTVYDPAYYSSRGEWKSGLFAFKWLKQLSDRVIDLFNLKINTMKKLSFLSVALIAAAIILIAVCSDSNAQSVSKVRKVIEKANKDLILWFNSGEVDSILTLYRDDACIVGTGCGKAAIREHYLSQVHIVKFQELSITSLSVSDTLAVEKGRWVVRFDSGELLKGEYLTEWRRTGKQRTGRWQIVNDISANN